MKILKYMCIAAVAASFAATVACGHYETGGYAKGSSVMACDASFENVMEQEIIVFESKYNNSSILSYYVDENAAIDSLLSIDNNVRTAVAARPLNKSEIEYLNGKKRSVNQQAIAVDAIALIVNPANPVENLDYQDVVDILSGKYTTWDKIAGAGTDMGEIAVVFDHSGSSTTNYMRDSVLNGQPFGPNVYAQKSPREVFEKVASTKNAIGIIGVSWLTGSLSGGSLTEAEIARISDPNDTATVATFNTEVKPLAIAPANNPEYYKPTQFNIYKGNYPFYRQIWMISTSTPSSVGHSFFSFVTSVIGQKVILSTGVCPKVIPLEVVEI